MFDSHCHLDFPEFAADRSQVLARARAAGVNGILIPGVSQDNWQRLLTLCEQEADLFPALGLHPGFITQHKPEHLQQLAQMIEQHPVVAIGEIGLDFYLQDTDKSQQLFYFESQLKRANDADLPVLLHVRKAHDQVLKSLKKHPVRGGICHAFNGSLQQAQQYIALGFKLGFGGMLTYARSSKLRKLAQTLPLDAIVLETDAPDMVGASHQYQRNSPEYLPEIAKKLGEIKQLDMKVIAQQTTHNLLGVIRIQGLEDSF